MNSAPDPESLDDDFPLGGPADGELLRRFCEGEENAATELYVKYSTRLKALAKSQTSDVLAARFDSDDVVQSVFRSFFRRAASGHYDVPEGEELWNLLLVITLNKIRKLGAFHRAAKRNVEATTSLFYPSASGSRLDEQAFRLLQMTIDDLLHDAPEANRKMIMYRIEGNDMNAISELTGRSLRTVERVLQSFRRKLASAMSAES